MAALSTSAVAPRQNTRCCLSAARSRSRYIRSMPVTRSGSGRPTSRLAQTTEMPSASTIVAKAKAQNVPVIIISHNLQDIFASADRIIVMARGKLIADGDARAIRDNPQVQEVYFGTGKTFRAPERVS